MRCCPARHASAALLAHNDPCGAGKRARTLGSTPSSCCLANVLSYWVVLLRRFPYVGAYLDLQRVAGSPVIVALIVAAAASLAAISVQMPKFAAIVPLIHDVFVTVGFLSLFHKGLTLLEPPCSPSLATPSMTRL
jgi:hypothetical protein